MKFLSSSHWGCYHAGRVGCADCARRLACVLQAIPLSHRLADGGQEVRLINHFRHELSS